MRTGKSLQFFIFILALVEFGVVQHGMAQKPYKPYVFPKPMERSYPERFDPYFGERQKNLQRVFPSGPEAPSLLAPNLMVPKPPFLEPPSLLAPNLMKPEPPSRLKMPFAPPSGQKSLVEALKEQQLLREKMAPSYDK
jgi:hypothetical protein